MKFRNFELCILLAYVASVYSQTLYFTQQPEAVYYAHSSIPFVIQCKSTGIRITYRRSNVALGTTNSNESYTRPTPEEGLDGSEGGVIWDCLTSDDNGVIVSSKAIVYWAKFVDSSSSGETTVTLLDTVNAYLPCNFFNESLPPPVIGWEKGGSPIANAKILAGSNSLLLGIFEAVIDDTYSCFLENRFGNPSNRIQATQTYKISAVSSNTFSVPPLVYPYSDFTSTVGENIYFECVGYTQNCVWQQKVGGAWENIPTDNSQYSGVELSLTVASDTPTEYRVVLGGTIQPTRTLTIYELPRVVSSIEGALVEYEQQTITISCERSGFPDPTVELYQGSVLVGDQAGKYSFTTVGNTTTLEIQDLDSLDTGYYTCRADSSQASAVASGRIIVRVAENPPNSIGHTTSTINETASSATSTINEITSSATSTINEITSANTTTNFVTNFSSIIIAVAITIILMSIIFLTIITILLVVIVIMYRKNKHLKSPLKHVPTHPYEYIDLNIVSPDTTDPKDSAYYTPMESVHNQANTNTTPMYMNLK